VTDIPGVAPAVVVYRTTIMDGTVLSWFLNLGAAKYGRPVISASRVGVMVHGDTYLHQIPRPWLDAAEEAHAALCLGRDVEHMATHRRTFPGWRTLPGMDLEEIKRTEATS
jgi:hypothetical protein